MYTVFISLWNDMEFTCYLFISVDSSPFMFPGQCHEQRILTWQCSTLANRRLHTVHSVGPSFMIWLQPVRALMWFRWLELLLYPPLSLDNPEIWISWLANHWRSVFCVAPRWSGPCGVCARQGAPCGRDVSRRGFCPRWTGNTGNSSVSRGRHLEGWHFPNMCVGGGVKGW